MKPITITALALAAALSPLASASGYISATSLLPTAPIDFEGFADGTLLGAGVYPGVTFGQPDGGLPQIDNHPFLFGYVQSSGVGVLTGSMTGGAPFPTVAGLTATFSTPQSSVEAFFSDYAPLGDYTAAIYGTGHTLLESLTIPAGSLPTTPTPGSGLYVGFSLGSAMIESVQYGPSGAYGDAFAIDDLRFAGGSRTPDGGSSLALLSLGILGCSALHRKLART